MLARSLTVCLVGAATMLVGCSGPEPRADGRAASRTVVDSVHPIEEEIRRFARTAGEPATRLEGGAATREELVASFVAALEEADTAALAGSLITRSEFIHLYFPHSVYTKPPYQLDPAIVWFQMMNHTSRGITRTLKRFAGRPLRYLGHDCPAPPLVEGPNRIWEHCTVRLGPPGEEASLRLFGPILERDGRLKFVTYGGGEQGIGNR